eukprot:gnl/TRDRNA2_/TRDRNA2_92454_c0_seq1.p1 gnl/TRDRNA2_/TRDRNA2_92454_c0~~gnl/TRDRNA2_/TRDRNA2_92454_c0_seq1.p1  ORF type:complete len:223 (+),score=41.23 gnl/TRDRNA2_/TRDRNA2_92454_c0_seq1:42-710(+)
MPRLWQHRTLLIASTAACAGAVIWVLQRRRRRKHLQVLEEHEPTPSDADAVEDDETLTPRFVGFTPKAGPAEAPTAADPLLASGLRELGILGPSPSRRLVSRTDAASKSSEAAAKDSLDEGLRNLGMLPDAVDPARKSVAVGSRDTHHFEHGVQDDGNEADEVVVVERVSPEEEERRYFANLGLSNDLFGDLPPPAASAQAAAAGADGDTRRRQRKVVGYES